MKVAAKDVARWEARRFDAETSAVAAIVVFVTGNIIWEIIKQDPITIPNGAVVRAP